MSTSCRTVFALLALIIADLSSVHAQCSSGVSDGTACCAASCGSCGGSGCSQRSGGASGCCVGVIMASGIYCDHNDPPCIESTRTICHPNQYENLVQNNLSVPWFPSISDVTTYDADWPSWTTAEQTVYESLSKELFMDPLGVSAADIDNIVDPTNIRAHYGSFTSEISSLSNALLCTLNMSISTAHDRVVKQLCFELGVLTNLNDFKVNLKAFYTASQAAFHYEADAIVNLLENEPGTVAAVVSSGSGASSWDTAVSVANSFAGLFGIFLDGIPSIAIQLSSWFLTASQGIGDNIIDGRTDSGPSYSVTVNLNNALWNTAYVFLEQISETFETDINLMSAHQSSIANNSGKLMKFAECYSYYETAKYNAGINEDAIQSSAIQKARYGMKLATFKALIPSKYQFWAQFSCSSDLDSGEHGDCCWDPFTKGPACDYEQAQSLSQSTTYSVGKGHMVGFLGAKGSDDPSAAISEMATTVFNQVLKNVTDSDEYTLNYILDHLDDDGWNQSFITSKLTVQISDILSFSFNASMASSSWCDYQCYGKTGYFCTENHPWVSACQHCDDSCDSKCGESCGSCISSSANVLMADSSYKAISDIVVGDSVMDPVTGSGHTVNAIQSPLRNRRELYSINGLDFKFTKAHPFLVYMPSLNKSMYKVSAVDKEAILFYVPTWSEDRVQNMVSDDNLSVYSSSGISPLYIDNIETFVFDESVDSDGEILYDLVLDLSEPSMYVIDDGVIVHNEWYDFNAYPKSTQVILGMLYTLVQTESHTLHQLSRNEVKSRQLVNEIATLISHHRLSFYEIINDRVDDVLSTQNESVSKDGYCQAFVLDDSAKGDVIGALYNDDFWAIGKAIEEFIARIGPKLNYVFHSEDADIVCFDDVDFSILVEDLLAGLDEALQDLEEYLIVTQVETTANSAMPVESTEGVADNAIAWTVTVCFYVIVCVVLFV